MVTREIICKVIYMCIYVAGHKVKAESGLNKHQVAQEVHQPFMLA